MVQSLWDAVARCSGEEESTTTSRRTSADGLRRIRSSSSSPRTTNPSGPDRNWPRYVGKTQFHVSSAPTYAPIQHLRAAPTVGPSGQCRQHGPILPDGLPWVDYAMSLAGCRVAGRPRRRLCRGQNVTICGNRLRSTIFRVRHSILRHATTVGCSRDLKACRRRSHRCGARHTPGTSDASRI